MDKNLRLALLDEVERRRDEYYWVAKLRDRYQAERHAGWPAWSQFEEMKPEHAAALQDFLAAIPIDPAELATIDHLTLDGDHDLYQWVYPYWWDFGDHFTIRDLSGIEQCSALDYLSLGQGLVEGCSLEPLAKLPHLRELHLCALCNHFDMNVLLEIPSLQKLEVINVASSPQRAAWESLLAARSH